MLARLVLLLLIAPVVAISDDTFCLTQYKTDFAFAKETYVVDAANGITAEVSWGPHGYVGAILLPREGERDRVPLERFETFYRSFNCQWASIQEVWNYSLDRITSRQECTALVFGGAEASFSCNGLLESYRLDEDVLGPFREYELKGSGPWYQTQEYFEARKQLEQLKNRAVESAFNSVTDASALPRCEKDLKPVSEKSPDVQSRHLPDPMPLDVDATIEFTVGTDGKVSEIIMRETASYEFEYLLAWAARESMYATREEPCRNRWVYTFTQLQ